MSQTYEDPLSLAAWNALSSSVPKIVVGTYTGNGQASQFIDLGFTPKAIFVCPRNFTIFSSGSAGYFRYGGLAVTGSPMHANNGNPVIEITGTGFRAYYDYSTSDHIMANNDGTIYNYIAAG